MKIDKRLIIIVVIALFLVGVAGYFLVVQHRQLQEIQSQSLLDKQLLESEYSDLSTQYEGVKITVHNDSIVAKLTAEQAKVRSLLEELKMVKSTNAKRIMELRRQLTGLRQVMRHYIIQIDSLNRSNQRLREENKSVKTRISQVSKERNELAAEKKVLTDKVKLAEKLSISAITAKGLDRRGRVTSHIKKMTQLAFSFTIDRNVTAPTGMKMIYALLMKPDDSPLTKPNSGTFDFEGKAITYSMKKEIEYTGEPQTLTLYWNIEEYLEGGTYRILFFADGYQIGATSFTL